MKISQVEYNQKWLLFRTYIIIFKVKSVDCKYYTDLNKIQNGMLYSYPILYNRFAEWGNGVLFNYLKILNKPYT